MLIIRCPRCNENNVQMNDFWDEYLCKECLSSETKTLEQRRVGDAKNSNDAQEESGEMNQKELRYAFNQVLLAAGKLECEDLHHKPKHEHDAGYLCPARYALQKHIRVVREYMKEQKISS